MTKKLTHSITRKELVIKSVILLLIPYAYLFLCGFIFDMLLKWYFMTTFIFISMLALYVIAIVLIIMNVVTYRRKTRTKERREKEWRD